MSVHFLVCQACLSKDRQMFPIRKLQHLLIDVDVVDLNLSYEGSLCWECKSIIIKFSKFKKQVEFAQFALQDTVQLQDFKSLSTLSCSESCMENYSITHHDPLNSDVEPIQIKQEMNDFNNAEYSDHNDYDEKPELKEEIDIDTQETEIKKEATEKNKKIDKNTKIKDKIKYTDLEHDDVKEKFVEVQFTEEEMIKNREEKRSHPNFKKLPFNCDTCVLGFTRKENYDLHVKKKHSKSIGSHMCPVCEVRFTGPTALTKHVKKHYHCYRCKLCTYETSELWSALNHCRSKHSGDSEDSIHCQQCSYVAKSREELAEHSKTQHSVICNECGEKFKAPSTLKKHLSRIHGTVRDHPCPLCPRAFRGRGRLESHMTSHGAQAAARLAYCVTCRVQYKNIYVYRNHLTNSANHCERRFHCEECGKKFASKDYYKRHLTFYHQKKSRFKCELCDQLFISDWKLRHHKQMRHGMPRPKNHECEQCGKKFYTLGMMKSHALTHSAQRSFMCAHCGDTFKQRPALYTHTRLVHRGLKRQAT